MRILVTGGAGFIPSHLCERLIEQGHEVVGVDNFITGHRRNLVKLLTMPAFRFVEADVTKELPVEGRFDRIYHMASPASPIDYVQLPFETLYCGSDATRIALDRCRKDGARFFLASTSEVYGDPLVHPQPETYWGNVNSIGPRSVYDEAKRFAEAVTMAYHRYHGVETRIVRIFNTYGPRMRENDGRVMPAFISQALRRQPLTVFGDGLQTRSFCFVDDNVRGLMGLMESDLAEPCNIGNPHEMTMLQLAEYINAFTGNTAGVIHKPLPTDDPLQRKPIIERARSTFGWEPHVSFEEGVERTVAYFRDIVEL
jgi:dTDP-glucose 4,6-dehydratase